MTDEPVGQEPKPDGRTRSGKARMATMSPEERKTLAKKAAKKRWKKKAVKKQEVTPFGDASSYAEKRLLEANKELSETIGKKAMLEAEIKGLIGIIRAFRGVQAPAPIEHSGPMGIPVNYDVARILADAPLPSQVVSQPTVPSRVGGGAIEVPLPEPQDEDAFLKESNLPGGNWI